MTGQLSPQLVQAIQERARQDKQRAYERVQASGLEPTEMLMNAMTLRSMAEALYDFLPEMLGEEDQFPCYEHKLTRRHWWQFWKRGRAGRAHNEPGDAKPQRH